MLEIKILLDFFIINDNLLERCPISLLDDCPQCKNQPIPWIFLSKIQKLPSNPSIPSTNQYQQIELHIQTLFATTFLLNENEWPCTKQNKNKINTQILWVSLQKLTMKMGWFVKCWVLAFRFFINQWFKLIRWTLILLFLWK